MTDQELNEKLALWRGFKSREAPYWGGVVWDYPDDISTTAYMHSPPNFLNSETGLSLQFKWLVPKLPYVYSYDFDRGRHTWILRCNVTDDFAGEIVGEADTPAQALAEAIGQAVNGKQLSR